MPRDQPGSALLKVALDENFPLNLVRKLDAIPGIELSSVYDIDARCEGLDDWQLVVALHRRQWSILATSDTRMLSETRTLTAIQKTSLTLVAVEGLGHHAVRATGALLYLLPAVARAYLPDRPQIFQWGPRDPVPRSPQHHFGLLATRAKRSVQELMTESALTDHDLRDPLSSA